MQLKETNNTISCSGEKKMKKKLLIIMGYGVNRQLCIRITETIGSHFQCRNLFIGQPVEI